jgi:serine/threonine-protein kinase
MQAAIASMDRALALDPAFALGHAERARLLLYFYLNFSDTLPEAARAREQALLAASEALRLSPNLGEAHRALGLYYYWGLFDYPSAQRELALAQETLPNDSVSAWILGLVRRRQNRFDEAVDLFREAYSLNPGDQTARETYALALLDGGRYAEADAVIADLLARFPEARDPLFGRALLHFCRTGDTGALRAAAASGLDSRDMEDYSRWLAARFEGRLEEALAVVQAGSSFTFGLDFRPWALAESYFLLDDPAAAAAAVQPQIDRIESALKAAPDQLGVDLGLPDSYLFAGQPADARRAARDLLKHTPVERSAVEYWIARAILTRTYAFLGDTEESLDLLALVQSGPERDCGNVLRHDPAFAHLRDEPRFQQITAASDWK